MIELLNDDCLKVLSDMAVNKQSVDLIITSPPYNMNLRVMGGKYVSRCRNRNHKSEFSTKYENYNDDLPMDEYFTFQKEFIEKAMSVTDLMFYNIQMVTGNKVALFRLFGEFADKIKELIVWDKNTAQPAMATKTLNSRYELIVVFQNSKPYNRQFDNAIFARGSLDNLWTFKRERNPDHKAAFPVALAEHIIKNFTKPGAVVLDPFMGSGTTGVASRNLGRNFVGIEIDRKYYEIAERKINERLI
nr:MAG TPA: adenine-specific methyltransferase [Microviridae sp.]